MEKQYRRFRAAVRNRDQAAMCQLIRDFPALQSYEGGHGSLVEVIDHEAPELLEEAFQAGLSPDAGKERPIHTFLQSAACEGRTDMVRLALRYGADLEKRNEDGETALGYACDYGHLEVVKALVEAGANVNAVEEHPENGFRNTALDCARDHPDIIAYLRSKGAKYLHELDA